MAAADRHGVGVTWRLPSARHGPDQWRAFQKMGMSPAGGGQGAELWRPVGAATLQAGMGAPREQVHCPGQMR